MIEYEKKDLTELKIHKMIQQICVNILAHIKSTLYLISLITGNFYYPYIFVLKKLAQKKIAAILSQ